MPKYEEIFDGPARNFRRDANGNPILSAKKYITLHNTSNNAPAENEASFAKHRTDGVSSHYYADNNSIVQSLNTDWCANHVGSAQGNTYGISYEITGFNAWSPAKWRSDVAWDLVAKQIAVDCRHFGIPALLLTIEEMKKGRDKGFITHDMARKAWGGTTHTDPGPGFPMDHLLAKVQTVLDRDEMAVDMSGNGHLPSIERRTEPVLTVDLWAQEQWGVSPYDLKTPSGRTAQLARMEQLLQGIAAKVHLDGGELDALRAAAANGARAGVTDGAQSLAASVAGALRDEVGLSEAEAEAAAERAVQSVLGRV